MFLFDMIWKEHLFEKIWVGSWKVNIFNFEELELSNYRMLDNQISISQIYSNYTKVEPGNPFCVSPKVIRLMPNKIKDYQNGILIHIALFTIKLLPLFFLQLKKIETLWPFLYCVSLSPNQFKTFLCLKL